METNSKLQHLTEEQIQILIERYYAKENIKELIKEFNINCTPSNLVQLFPPRIIEDEEPCEYCGSKLVQKCISRSCTFISNPSYCPTCGHNPDDERCTCVNCLEQEKKISEIKKTILKDKYPLRPLKNISELSLREKLYLATILKDVETITDESKRTIILPLTTIMSKENSRDQEIEMLLCLIDKKIIAPSWKSDVTAFSGNLIDENYGNKFYIAYVRYTVNIVCTKEELINSINLEDYDIEDIFQICREISLGECYNFLNNHMKKVKFDFNPGEKTKEIFSDLLDEFSVRQVFSIIYNSISNSTRYYQEGNVSRTQAANSVITRCKNYGNKILENEWEIRNFPIDYNYEEPSLNILFFSKILPLKYKAYTTRLSIDDVSNIVFEQFENSN